MASIVVAIVLTTVAAILLSLMTLTTMAPWAVISLSLVGLFLVGKELHWFEA